MAKRRSFTDQFKAKGLLKRSARKSPSEIWLGRMQARKPKMLVTIALTNKMARQIGIGKASEAQRACSSVDRFGPDR